MKKKLIVISMLLVALVTMGIVGFAFAQSQEPQSSVGSGETYGPGMMGGWGGRGMRMMGWGSGSYGPMHEFMQAALAKALGLTVEELEARIQAGETPYEIAQAQGLNDDQIRELFTQAHAEALQNAVEAGVITQEQAGWMAQHHEQMQPFGGPGSGACHGGGRRGGPGGRWNNQPEL
jgi:hypothetical protein